MTVSTITLESATAEKIRVTCRAPEDPTGAAVQFELTSNDTASPAGSWSAGTWETGWDATTERATAFTPTIGVSGTLTVTQGSWYKLWVRYSSTVVKHAATIRVT